MILKLGMQHHGLNLYKVCVNGNPGLTFTHFTSRSELVACAVKCEKLNCYKVIKWEKRATNYQINRRFIFLKHLDKFYVKSPGDEGILIL